jgi:hypothetical protein
VRNAPGDQATKDGSYSVADVEAGDAFRLLLFTVERRDEGDHDRSDDRLEGAEQEPEDEEGSECAGRGMQGQTRRPDEDVDAEASELGQR